MKKNIFLITLGSCLLSLVSCDLILKPKPNKLTDSIQIKDIFLGTDSDSNGCVASAGYKWSKINQECIRVFEKGIRLIPANEKFDANEDDADLAMVNAYVLFNDTKKKVEIFLPSEKYPIEMKKIADNTYEYKDWKLDVGKQYQLKRSEVLMYVSPVATEKQIEANLEYDLSESVITE